MKKLRNLLLLLVLAALLVTPVAAASGKAAMDPQIVTAKAGETFKVTVVLSDAGKIDVGSALVSYDPGVLTFLGGKCLVSNTAFAQVIPDKNVGTFLLDDAREVSGDLFSFEFMVNKNAAVGQYSIDLKVSVGDGKGDYIQATGAMVQVTGEDAPTGNQDNTPDATTPDAPDATTPDAPDVTAPGTQTPEGTTQNPPAQDATIQDSNAQDSAGSDKAPAGQENGEPAGFPWWILLVIAAAAAVVAVLVIGKKKPEEK